MARPLRIENEDACYHVMDRGNGRQRVFHGDDDHGLFLDKLVRPVETFRVWLRAFCLMANHFHPYMGTPEADLSRSTPCGVRGWNGPFAPGKGAMMLVRRCDPTPRPDPS